MSMFPFIIFSSGISGIIKRSQLAILMAQSVSSIQNRFVANCTDDTVKMISAGVRNDYFRIDLEYSQINKPLTSSCVFYSSNTQRSYWSWIICETRARDFESAEAWHSNRKQNFKKIRSIVRSTHNTTWCIWIWKRFCDSKRVKRPGKPSKMSKCILIVVCQIRKIARIVDTMTFESCKFFACLLALWTT